MRSHPVDTKRFRRAARLVTAGAAVLLIGACGQTSEVNSSASIGASSAPPTTSTTSTTGDQPGSSEAQRVEGYDTSGRDVDAICAQLLVIAKAWDGAGYTGPAPSTPAEKAAVAKQLVDELSAASAELDKIAPPDLARDMAAQVEGAKLMYAPVYGGSIPTASVLKEKFPPGQGQPGLEKFAMTNCGFSVFDYGK